MREIKFRAWDNITSKYVMLNPNVHNPTDAQGVTISINTNIDHKVVVFQNEFYYGRDVSLVYQQFTGLTDINGTDIYEGDIVYLAGYGNYEVEFPFIELYEASFESDIGAILGNIYENKELVHG